ncbi:hypothetical protein [Oceanipulchritudo coccoides]|nr:hypothetical protein [Oceanipulchritudo coccoides]
MKGILGSQENTGFASRIPQPRYHESGRGNPSCREAQQGQQPKSGHREREHHTYRPLRMGESITQKVSHFDRHGNTMECDTRSTFVVTGSNKVIEADKVKAFCSVCGNAESEVILSAISQQSLCERCRRVYESPAGEKLNVSPHELHFLLRQHDTWKDHDRRNKS